MATARETVQSSASAAARSLFDVERVRRDFPILTEKIHGRPLVYFDNAATSQKPRAVIEAERRFYENLCANVHRGVHWLSEQATRAYEDTRIKLQRFLNAAESREIIFVRGTTEAINLVASTYGRKHIQAGDEIIISGMEHHSNIVPWQMLCEEKGSHLRIAPVLDNGELDLEGFEALLNSRTRFVAVAHVSNVLGTINPVKRIIEMAHLWNVPVLLDGAQAAPHMRIDVRALDCDFYTVSGHKLFAPTGIGALYGKAKWLEAMPPYQGGGDMIASVTFEKTIYNTIPYKFEAGTPNIAGTLGFAAAVDYLEGLGFENFTPHEHDLLAYATEAISRLDGVRIIGTAREKAAVISFVMEGIHPHDVGTILDREGIAVRTGHHCAQPLMDRFGVPATTRASLAFYNTMEEIDGLVKGIQKVKEFLG